MYTEASVAVIFVSLIANVLSYSDCGSKVGEIISVNIGNCNNVGKCILRRDTNVSLTIEFKSKVATDAVKAIVHGVILDAPIPFPLPNDNGCVDSGLQCPLKSGETYKYTTVLPVKKDYPKMSLDVKWELKSKEDEDLVCMLVPARLQ